MLFLALLILSSPILYNRVAWLYNSKVCFMNGGAWIRIGLAQEPACIITYLDAGKVCQSSEECMGKCVIYDPPIQGQPISGGVCKGTNSPFGCYAVIERPEFYACFD